MDTDGAVAAEHGVVALDVPRNNGIGGTLPSGAVNAVSAERYVLTVVGHHVVGTADGVGAFEQAYGFDANRHVLGGQADRGDQQGNRKKAKSAEERWHGLSRIKCDECTPK